MIPLLKFSLDSLIESKLLITANSGGGKSRAIRWIAETYHGKIQQIIIDREGEFSTLREKFPYVLVGRDGDIAADVGTVKLLAQKLMELKSSAIIDLSEMSLSQQRDYVKLFVQAINHLPRKYWQDCLIVIDEAHLFAPETAKGKSAATEEIALMASTSRKRGYCLILATQRLAKLNKDCAAELLNKMIGRTSNEDGKRAAEELNHPAKEGRLMLRALQPGQFWCYGPAIGIEPTLATTGDVQTSPPKRGRRRQEPAEPQAVIQRVLAELADLPREAEEEEQAVVALRRQVSELQRQARYPSPDPMQQHNAVAAERRRWEVWLSNAMKGFDAHLMGLPEAAKQLASRIEGFRELTKSLTERKPGSITPMKTERPVVKIMHGDVLMSLHFQGGSLSQKVLDGLAKLNQLGVCPASKQALAGFIGFKVSGHFNNTLGKLRSQGLIDYPSGGMLALTPAGERDADGSRLNITSADDLHMVWLSKLNPLQATIMRPLIEHYPTAFDKAQLAAMIGYEVSGHFNNMLGSLRTLGLITKRGPIAATSILFPPGLS